MTRLSPATREHLRGVIQAKILADHVTDLSDEGLTRALRGTVMPGILTEAAIALRDAGELEAAE